MRRQTQLIDLYILLKNYYKYLISTLDKLSMKVDNSFSSVSVNLLKLVESISNTPYNLFLIIYQQKNSKSIITDIIINFNGSLTSKSEWIINNNF